MGRPRGSKNKPKVVPVTNNTETDLTANANSLTLVPESLTFVPENVNPSPAPNVYETLYKKVKEENDRLTKENEDLKDQVESLTVRYNKVSKLLGNLETKVVKEKKAKQ